MDRDEILKNKRAAVVCDNWKLPTFERVLADYGLTIEKKFKFTKNSTGLHVTCPDIATAVQIAEACATAQEACRQQKRNSN